MSFLLRHEKQAVEQASQTCKVMRNLQRSKAERLKLRTKTLLASKRGLTTAFLLGLAKGTSKNNEGRSKKSALASATRIGLSTYLG